MFRSILSYLCACIIVIFLITTGCRKDDEESNALDPYNSMVPVLTTINISGITQNSAISGGRITSNGGSPITSKGICWSASPSPKIINAHTNDGSGNSDFTSVLNGLGVGITYYVRAYAINSAGAGYGNERTFTTPDTLFTGINFAGGIIFYLDTSGFHGFVCAENDQDTSARWGCAGDLIAGADGTTLGTGWQNTSEIISGCDSVGIAARICSDLILNGYDDWHLPSKDELILIYNVLKTNGDGNFSNGAYWSSSEMTNDFAWQVIFGNGIVQGVNKNSINSVRAVRAF